LIGGEQHLSRAQRQPAIAVDCVVFDSEGRLLLIRRKNPPFKGQYALPGGFVEYGEPVEYAARRELQEETGLKVRSLHLIGAYSDPRRDPRGHIISIAYLAVEPRCTSARGGDDAAAAEFIGNWRKLKLAFDHNKIVRDAVALIAAS
jgi:8-oxo-dGTP diphosphatase